MWPQVLFTENVCFRLLIFDFAANIWINADSLCFKPTHHPRLQHKMAASVPPGLPYYQQILGEKEAVQAKPLFTSRPVKYKAPISAILVCKFHIRIMGKSGDAPVTFPRIADLSALNQL